jgi:hypothetical protein
LRHCLPQIATQKFARNEQHSVGGTVERSPQSIKFACVDLTILQQELRFLLLGEAFDDGGGLSVSGGMKVVESWRFEIPFSSAAFSSDPSR